MGQCMSRKAAGAFAASAAAAHNRPAKMHKQTQLQSPGDDDGDVAKKTAYSKGVATSFGFKRRPTTAPSIASNSTAARRLASADIIDRNGNGHADTEPLTSNMSTTARSTPKLMPPKKEGAATRVNRFGFRQPQSNRLSKVSDLNNPTVELCNNNLKVKSVGQGKIRSVTTVDANKNRMIKIGTSMPQAERFMLQTTHLPRPEPIRLIETKTAKTIANNSRRIAYHEDNSSKEGSWTEDSGVGSQISADAIPGIERLNCSPTYGARRSFHKSRNLEIIQSEGKFDVRDLDDFSEACAPLPQLPSAFNINAESVKSNVFHTGFVREKAREYQRHLDDNKRKISVTSSEGFSDDYHDEEKTFRDKFKSEKTFIKGNKFIKTAKSEANDSSPPSSDEQYWGHAGEAMADEVSISMSSSDESKDQVPVYNPPNTQNVPNFSTVLRTLMNESLNSSKAEIKNMILTIEDPKFAAVASNASLLLDDETSPVDSLLSCSESEEMHVKNKVNRSSSNSKDINEKLTPPSPGTPTNVSTSLSLSDGKDDFLIDDEIADQPALVFEKTLVPNETFSISQNSESTNSTMVDSTPKPKRKSFVDGSPLALRKRKHFHSRTGSLDTLSPCESIASDDLMMDYDYSQSSGVEDDRNDSHNHGFNSLDDAVIRRGENDLSGGIVRDWSSLLGNLADKNLKSNASKSRLLWSRTGTPNSVPDSPKSVDSKSTARSRHSVNSSPLRLGRAVPLSAGYDSDDSIRLDRANHSAMKQDIMSIKTMLLKLKRVLNESETHIPFDNQLTNGLFNGLSSSGDEAQNDDDFRVELAELRRQVLFLQGQLEDKDRIVVELQEKMIKLTTDNYTSNSAPASSVVAESLVCNAATQTERVRPISAGPSLLNGSPTDGSNVGSLVSANESPLLRRSRPFNLSDSHKKPTAKLWRKPGEPPSPQRYSNTSSLPRRANSRTRTPSVPT